MLRFWNLCVSGLSELREQCTLFSLQQSQGLLEDPQLKGGGTIGEVPP